MSRLYPGHVESDWGAAVLHKTRVEITCCGCDSCDGHEHDIPLPESEWWWGPAVLRVDMSDLLRLEDSRSSLFTMMQGLGK